MSDSVLVTGLQRISTTFAPSCWEKISRNASHFFLVAAHQIYPPWYFRVYEIGRGLFHEDLPGLPVAGSEQAVRVEMPAHVEVLVQKVLFSAGRCNSRVLSQHLNKGAGATLLGASNDDIGVHKTTLEQTLFKTMATYWLVFLRLQSADILTRRSPCPFTPVEGVGEQPAKGQKNK